MFALMVTFSEEKMGKLTTAAWGSQRAKGIDNSEQMLGSLSRD